MASTSASASASASSHDVRPLARYKRVVCVFGICLLMVMILGNILDPKTSMYSNACMLGICSPAHTHPERPRNHEGHPCSGHKVTIAAPVCWRCGGLSLRPAIS